MDIDGGGEKKQKMALRCEDFINATLPDELLEDILGRVGASKASLDTISLVCRRWLRLDRSSRRSIRIGGSDHADLLVSLVVRRFPALTSVHIDERIPTSFAAAYSDPSSFLAPLSDSLRQRFLAIHSLLETRRVNEYLSDTGLDILAQSYRNLEKLSLQCCSHVTDAGLESIARNCKGLKSLDLQGCYIGDHGLAAIGENCRHLEDLNLRFCECLFNAGLVELARGCPYLRTLKLQCGKVTDVALQAVGSHCPELELLALHSSERFTDGGLSAIAHGCRKLKNLSLSDCDYLTQEGMAFIASGCTSLTHLEIDECDNIFSYGLETVGKKCSNLKELGLLYCQEIGNSALFEVGRGCSLLQSLRLVDCPDISDDAICRIADGCRNLKKLHVCRSDEIGDRGIIAIGQSCRSLKQLILQFCDGVGDDALISVGQNCPLQHLNVSGCRRITDVGITAIARGCPDLVTETAHMLDKLIGDVEDAVSSSMSGKMKASSCNAKELQLLAIRSLKKTEKILSSFSTSGNNWARLVSAVDNRVDRALAVLRPQAIADHRSLLVSLGWPPALSNFANPEDRKSIESVNPLVTMDGDLKGRYYESFHALCNLQEFQIQRKCRQLEGHNLHVALRQPLWTIEELVNPIALASQKYFSKWIDKPEFIFALVYKITRDFVDSMDEILQPLVDKARLVGYSCREEWIAAIVASLNTYLAREVFSAHVARLEDDGSVGIPTQRKESWLNLIDSMLMFDKKIQSLIVNAGLMISVKEVENLKRVSSLSVFCDRPDWLEIWAGLELEDALGKLKQEMGSERSWRTKIDAALLFSSLEHNKSPAITNIVLQSLAALIDRSRPIPDVALRYKFISLAGVPLLRHFFDTMLCRCQEAEGLTALADDDALIKVCTSINAARHCESVLTEWLEDVFFIEMVSDPTAAGSESSFIGEDIQKLQDFSKTWLEKISSIILRGFDVRCREYIKNKKQWQEKGDEWNLSTSFVEALDHLQGKLSKLQGDINEIDFTGLWRHLASGLDHLIFTGVLTSNTKFNDVGVERFGCDMGVLFGVFKEWCLRPDGFLPKLSDSLKLLNLEPDLWRVLAATDQKQKFVKDRGLRHLTVEEVEKIIKNRIYS